MFHTFGFKDPQIEETQEYEEEHPSTDMPAANATPEVQAGGAMELAEEETQLYPEDMASVVKEEDAAAVLDDGAGVVAVKEEPGCMIPGINELLNMKDIFLSMETINQLGDETLAIEKSIDLYVFEFGKALKAMNSCLTAACLPDGHVSSTLTFIPHAFHI